MRLRTKFQDEDFELGEVVDASIMYGYGDKIEVSCTEKMKHRIYDSIKDFTDHWEDAPEGPKKNYWYIDGDGETYQMGGIANITKSQMVDIGNYFKTKEEAEKAVEKLKGWKRLKDKGFKFTLTPGVGSLDITPGKFQIEITAEMPAKWFCCDAVQEDLDDCFGGEE